jgi:hypothetical protein
VTSFAFSDKSTNVLGLDYAKLASEGMHEVLQMESGGDVSYGCVKNCELL